MSNYNALVMRDNANFRIITAMNHVYIWGLVGCWAVMGIDETYID